MASVVIAGDVSGTCTLQAANAAGTTVLTLPTTSGTLVATNGSPTFVTVTSTTDNTTTLNATTGNITTVTAGLGNASAPSITFTGDTNTGIFSPTADTIAFTEGGTESMRIDASGNVGIGTTSFTDRLQIENASANCLLSVARTTGGAGGRLVMQHTNVVGALQTTAAVPLTFGTNDIERMRIDSSGNVFVGGTTQNTANKPVYSQTTAKAWVNFTGSTSPTIQSSFNVSSITYNGTGDFTANFTSAMPNANLVGAGFARISGNGGFVQMANDTVFTTTTFRFGTAVNGGGFSNPIITGVVVFGA